MSGATVLVGHSAGDHGDGWFDATAIAVTSDQGVFHVDPLTGKQRFASLLNPPDAVGQFTSVCFGWSHRRVLGAIILARTDRLTPYSPACNLKSQPIEFKQDANLTPAPPGICGNAAEHD